MSPGSKNENQTALVLDFASGYLLAGHVFWQGHFFILCSPSKAPLKGVSLLLGHALVALNIAPPS